MKNTTISILSAVLLTGTMQGMGSAKATEITVMGYRGAFEENYVRAVVKPFMKIYPDIQVTHFGAQNAGTELATMRAQKAAPQANAVIFDLSVAKIARDEGLVVNLDTTKISNYADLADLGKDLDGYAMPLTYDTVSLIYNRDAYPTPPTSWNALWDDKQRGKVIIPAPAGGDIQTILLTIITNRLAGENEYKRTIDPAVKKLIALAPNVQTWEPKPDQYTLVGNGTATISFGYNARSQFFFDQTQGRLRSTVPVEGSASQINVISAIANAPDVEATRIFINYALGPEAQAAFAKAMFYAPSNKKTVVDDATRKRIPLMDPEQQARLIPVDWMSIGDLRTTMLQPWRRQIIPAGR
jgi:putative spermidine/putrescine transport system substrate-binding protein